MSSLELGLVEGLLFALEFTEQVFLDALRQVLGDLHLGAPQQERTDACRKTSPAKGVFLGVEKFLKIPPVAEDAGHRKGHQAPEIHQLVLNGSAAQ